MKWRDAVHRVARLLGWIGFLGNTALAVVVSLGYLAFSLLPGKASLSESLAILVWVLAFTMYAAIGYIAAHGKRDQQLVIISIRGRWKVTVTPDPLTLLIIGAASAALPIYIIVHLGLL